MKFFRAVVVFLCAIGVGVTPAFAASLSVASNKMTTFHTCVLSGVANTSTVVAEATANQGSANTNNGSATTVTVSSASGGNQRAYIRFDLTKCLPAISSSATISSALLRPNANSVPVTCRTEDVFRVTSSWTESALTWNNQPFGTTVNNPASGSASAQMTIGTLCLTNLAAGYVTGWNVTSDVQAFVAGTATNNGWMIRDDSENDLVGAAASFATHETNNATKAPQLVIDYTT
jgi:hypothetical protein